MLLGVSSLFEMHPPSMHVDLLASLFTLETGGTTLMQTDPHPLFLKPDFLQWGRVTMNE